MKRSIILFVFLLLYQFTYAQEVDTLDHSVKHQKFLTMVNANREQSYITFASGLGNLEPLIFECKLSPSYFFTKQKRNWALMLNPQVTIRMLDQKSFPIRNPSYKVYVTYYRDIRFWKSSSFLKKVLFNNALWYGSVAHHSNGQNGSFYKPDSTRIPNLEDGNFATNFLEFGISSYRVEQVSKNYFSFREIKATFEWHPPLWSARELDDRYGFYRFFLKAGFVGPLKKRKNDTVNRWLQQSSLEMKAGWIMGKMNGASPVDVSKRFITDITYKYYPGWFDEIAFFVRFYRGQDYYNIYFLQTELTQFSMGITSNIMNFKNAVKYLK